MLPRRAQLTRSPHLPAPPARPACPSQLPPRAGPRGQGGGGAGGLADLNSPPAAAPARLLWVQRTTELPSSLLSPFPSGGFRPHPDDTTGGHSSYSLLVGDTPRDPEAVPECHRLVRNRTTRGARAQNALSQLAGPSRLHAKPARRPRPHVPNARRRVTTGTVSAAPTAATHCPRLS